MSFAADSRLVDRIHGSPNVEPRRDGLTPSILLLHYTGMTTAEAAILQLANPASKVSCHYVIDEGGVITQMVAEELRAWHAGASHWAGQTDINSASIGIEIHNGGHEAGLPPFPAVQMKSVEALSLDIARRHRIAPTRVLAHSDVAPARKIDPGERFDWAGLSRAGVGHWVEPAVVSGSDAGLAPGESGSAVREMQAMLKAYGYGIDETGTLDRQTELVVLAFQRHFRTERVDGRIDASSLRTLERLLAALPSRATS